MPSPYLGVQGACWWAIPAVMVAAELPTKSDVPRLDAATVAETLTASERAVLTCVVAGLADKEIARQRGVSMHTVRNQVRAIMGKTGMNKRVQLVALFNSTSLIAS
ncbi:helix-turn-helix transcriptional regulator [Rhodoferax ferrireducens]|uniref:helix-turn-helix transcriptional regulator n=1 Tax=Rhodoferax ferrireducens TaxID=192843 RepID=UPI00298ECC72|nr:helix-turn-helix transcriptional regulator [Rhodoferax ferrireducens]WPC67586.1 helix-turn-helix transcriptional regulator [Rhodoferax ferrireducens]